MITDYRLKEQLASKLTFCGSYSEFLIPITRQQDLLGTLPSLDPSNVQYGVFEHGRSLVIVY